MHDSLLAYFCFLATIYYIGMKQVIYSVHSYMIWCPWFIYGYVVRRLVANKRKNMENWRYFGSQEKSQKRLS